NGEGVVHRIDPTTHVITSFPLTGLNKDAEPIGIASQAGALWIAGGVLDSSIARVSTGGTVTVFPLPTPNARPYGIAVGADGGLWFTERDANQIGRITTGGGITEFPIPTPNTFPTDIRLSSDGAMWFIEGGAAKRIARVDLTGAITEFDSF